MQEAVNLISRLLTNKITNKRRMTPMTDMPNRDTIGKCDEGECRDRVREGEDERQHDINASDVETPDEYPHVKGAESRNEQPGIWGGHV
jgi:hypothetical protein